MAVPGNTSSRLSNYLKSIDVFLLLFISLFTIDKVAIKPLMIAAAVIGIWKALSLKDFAKAPLFYLLLPAWTIVRFLFVNTDFSKPHFISFSIGILYWLMAATAFIVVKKRVEKNNTGTTEKTLEAYFFINIAWSAGNLIRVMIASHSLNPYMLHNDLYGNSTGDYIRGLLMAPSFINMFINSFFCIYFLYRSKYAFAAAAAVVACLTTSNFATIAFIPVVAGCIFVLKAKPVRLAIIAILLLYGLINVVLSLSNTKYFSESFHQLVGNDQKDSTKTSSQGLILNADSLYKSYDSAFASRNPAAYQKTSKLNPQWLFTKYRYGKVYSVIQTFNYITGSAKNFLFGAGIGEFSSQLAERTSDLPVVQKSRIFDKLPVYVSPSFLNNNYKIFYTIYSLPTGYHSIRHFPTSFINQILGEYGFVGLVLFIVFYLWFFLKDYRALSYTIPMGLLLCYYLCFTYLFEYLSATVFFELFYLLDLKRYRQQTNSATK